VDRIGDTFRWKGENVSTSEVELVAMQYPQIKECSVYGVKVPNTDGRAGMILIVPQQSFNLHEFYNHMTKELPNYAVPYFVRLSEEVIITSTFKHKKSTLAEEGFDPSKTSDPLFFRDDGKKQFIPIDNTFFKEFHTLAKL